MKVNIKDIVDMMANNIQETGVNSLIRGDKLNLNTIKEIQEQTI